MATDYDSKIRNAVKNRLIECRKEKGISQKELAKAIESKETTVASWEQGKSLPSIAMLYKLANYYNKSIAYMYGEKDVRYTSIRHKRLDAYRLHSRRLKLKRTKAEMEKSENETV